MTRPRISQDMRISNAACQGYLFIRGLSLAGYFELHAPFGGRQVRAFTHSPEGHRYEMFDSLAAARKWTLRKVKDLEKQYG